MDRAEVTTVEGRYQLVMASVDAVRAGRCDPLDSADRVCRGLFLIAATDPLLAIAAGLTDGSVDPLIERHAWALVEGRDAAQAAGDPVLGRALERLAAVTSTTSTASDATIAAVAVERAAPDIVEPIAEAEVACAAR